MVEVNKNKKDVHVNVEVAEKSSTKTFSFDKVHHFWRNETFEIFRISKLKFPIELQNINKKLSFKEFFTFLKQFCNDYFFN